VRNGRSGAHAVCAYPVSPDARSPGAWKVATGREDVHDPPGARVGAAGVPCVPCEGSPGGAPHVAARDHEPAGGRAQRARRGARVGNMTHPDTPSTLGAHVAAAVVIDPPCPSYRGGQSADCRAVRARCARRGRRGRLGGPSGCVQGLGCTPRPLERGLGIFERRTGTPVARFGFQGARAGLAPRGGRCGIPVCTIARFGCRSHRYRLRRAPGPMSPNDGFMSAGPTPCVSSPPAKDRPTRFLQ